MKKFLIAATALSGLLAFAGSASAADPIVDPAYDWTGYYAGLQAGYGWGESLQTDGVATTGDYDIEGFIGGATLGANWQTGNLVFGVEGDISLSDITGDTLVACPTNCSTDIEWLGTLRARGGFAIDNLLLFATGGLAYGDVNNVTNLGNSNTETLLGWTAGGGVEWAFSEDISLKAEYLFVDLGHTDNFVGAVPIDVEVEKTHIARVGVNFHF